MRNKALLVGSIAFDIIFSVYNKFQEEILVQNGKVGSVSMMLTANNKAMYHGGTAANMAYGLGLQKENPLLFSVVGADFTQAGYRAALENAGVRLHVIEYPDEYTSTFYAITDQNKEQIGIFQPNVRKHITEVSLSQTISPAEFATIKVALFSPGTAASMELNMAEFAKQAPEAMIIFDPSQELTLLFDKPRLLRCLKMCTIFIGNETEIEQLQTLTGQNLQEILKLGPKYIIETKGKSGSIVHSQGKTQKIKSHKAKVFVDQTGAGDAYRAGLIKGLLGDLSITEACELGSRIAAKSVEFVGGQGYQL
jgi:adenosine kinase